ncbi:dihydropteroate synthase [Kocuria rosea]|uniref:dihydropteroate synthase n=1 Tax=Kocuria rosea TaxID=1275 RepID=UPI000A4B37BF|nr:dihydropteroate synthase [Kocuria polaris]
MPTPRRTDPAHRPPGWGSFEGLPTGRTLVMGILNVTPDSFSDGGEHAGHEAAIAHGLRMMAEGADIVDVGGESTRPGSERVDPAEERRRILPVVEALAAAGAVLSVDTLHAATAEAVLDAGAHIVNDVSGLAAGQEMIDLVAERQAPYVLMHARGLPDVQDSRAVYDDVAGEVLGELGALRERCLAAGLAPERLVLDPGLGFDKRGAQNWELLRALPRFTAGGHKVLVAASRKRFLGTLLEQDGVPRPAAGRDAATAAISALSAHAGAWCVRVHDVRASADAVAAAHAWRGVEPALLRPAAGTGTDSGAGTVADSGAGAGAPAAGSPGAHR